jgi:hypothetical protein
MYSLHPKKKCRYVVHIDQFFLSLTRFIKNINNICFSKQVYYKKIFDTLSNFIVILVMYAP